MEFKEIKDKYEKLSPLCENLKEEITYILQIAMGKEGIPYQQIVGRVKALDSFVEKASRLESHEPFKDIKDICGVRVICLFLSDLQRIGNIIESNFEVLEKDDKIYSQPDAFGYLSVHYIGKLLSTFSGPRYDGLKGLIFEIQVRTIAMHAWASISHYLDYKTNSAIPSDLRKDFNALSAMFYVADMHFELFFNSSEKDKKMAEGKASRLEIGGEEINLNTLIAYLKMKYKEREHSKPKNVSELAEELQISGYRTISQLDEAIRKGEKAFFLYEEKETETGFKFTDVGFVRGALFMVDEDYHKFRGTKEAFKKKCREYRNKVGS